MDPICPGQCPGQCVESYTSHPCMHSIRLTHTGPTRRGHVWIPYIPVTTPIAPTAPGASKAASQSRARQCIEGVSVEKKVADAYFMLFFILLLFFWFIGGEDRNHPHGTRMYGFFFFCFFSAWAVMRGGIGIGCEAWPVCRKRMK